MAWVANSHRVNGYGAADGAHGLPVTTTYNDLGQTVVNAGGVYTGANPAALTPIASGGGRGGGSVGASAGAVAGAGLGLNGSGGASITNAPTNAKDGAAKSYNDAIATLMGGVDSARAAAGMSRDHIISADADLVSGRGSAAGMSPAITNMNNTALALAPYADAIRGGGDSLARLAQALIAGNPSVGGIAGDYLGATRDAADALAALSPERYVSRAASDAQAAIDNARGQTERELARRGVNIGSGANAGLMNTLQRMKEAALLAATKTDAWQKGENEKIDALSKRAGLFKDVLATGSAAQEQATQNYAAAAGIVQKQGDMFGAAGDLSAKQASTFANIGGVEVNLGQLEMSNEKVLQDAVANVASAQQALAKFYQDSMDSETTTETYAPTGYTQSTQTTRRM